MQCLLASRRFSHSWYRHSLRGKHTGRSIDYGQWPLNGQREFPGTNCGGYVERYKNLPRDLRCCDPDSNGDLYEHSNGDLYEHADADFYEHADADFYEHANTHIYNNANDDLDYNTNPAFYGNADSGRTGTFLNWYRSP